MEMRMSMISSSTIFTYSVVIVFFFFQAEDGIRDIGVTGVQTCALPISLRQQLAGLAAEGLVASRPVPSGPGRPRSRWSLTASGLALFPRAYGQLTTELLGYLDDDDPALVDRLFEQRRRRRTEATLARLAGRPFDERVAELARVLDQDGYLADAERLDDGSWRIT